MKHAPQKQLNHLYDKIEIPNQPKIIKNNIQNTDLVIRKANSFEDEDENTNSNNFINLLNQKRQRTNNLSKLSKSKSNSIMPMYEIQQAINQYTKVPLYEPRSVTARKNNVHLYSFTGRDSIRKKTMKNNNNLKRNTIRNGSSKKKWFYGGLCNT